MDRPLALDLFCRAGGVSEGLRRAGFDVVGVDLLDCSKAFNRGPGNPAHPNPASFVQADALEFPLEGFDFIWASPPCQAHSVLRKLCPGKEYPDLIPATRERLIASGIPYCIENVPGAPLGGFLIQLCGTMFGLQTPDGRAELRRHRLFETSWPIALRPACQHGQAQSVSVTGTGMGIGNRRRALSISGHTSEISPSNWGRRAISATGNTAQTNVVRKTMTPQGELRRRAEENLAKGVRTISVTGATPQTNVINNQVRETFSTDDARAAMGISWMAMKDLSQAIPPIYAFWIALRALEELDSLREATRRSAPARS